MLPSVSPNHYYPATSLFQWFTHVCATRAMRYDKCMPVETPNLKRLRRRCMRRIALWEIAEFLLAGTLLSLIGGTVVLLAIGQPAGPVRPLGIVVMFAAWFAVWLLGGGLGCMVRLIAAGRGLLPRLDDATGQHLLLTTGWELAESERPLNPAEHAVVARAEQAAGLPERFAGVHFNRYNWRVWAALPIVAAAVAMICWLRVPGLLAGPDAAPPDAPHAGQARRAFVEIAAAAAAGGQGDVAADARSAAAAVNGADATSTVQQQQQRLDEKLRALAPVVEALGDLAAGPGGEPFTPVLAAPDDDTESARQQARSAARDWPAMDPAARARAAERLRAAAGRVESSDPELAAELRRLADALEAGQLADALDSLDRVVTRIHPALKRHHVLAEAAGRLEDLLRQVRTTPDEPAVAGPIGRHADTGLADDDPRLRAARSTAERELATRDLSPRQKSLLQRYFALDN